MIKKQHYSETLYSEISNNYDKTRWNKKGQVVDEIQKKLLWEILDKLNNNDLNKTKKILDVGAGTGRFVLDFAKRGYETYGIDISPKMLLVAKNKGIGLKNLHLKVANAKHIPFKDNNFDFITSFRVLIHIPDYEMVIYDISRVLKNEGYAILEFNNKYSLSGIGKIIRGIRKKLNIPEETDTIVTSIHKLKKIFKNCNLKIEKINYQFLIPEVFFKYLPYRCLSLIKRLDKFLCSLIFKKFATRMIILVKK